jgi:tyrosine-protein phosphatase YwqE
MSLFDFFKSKTQSPENRIVVDMHSHFLPGIDDGADNLDDSLEIIKGLMELGYTKAIATPHIMGDFFKNTPEIILKKLLEVKDHLKKNNIDFQVEAAAEYYLDEMFIEKLDKGDPLLSFGNKYLLFETSYINQPGYLPEAIFKLKSLGYKPVLAHPERYTYLYSGFDKFKEIFEREIYFQLNINSLAGYYSPAARKFAVKLIENNMVHFAGTDAHGPRHLIALKKAMDDKHYKKLLDLNLLNNTLL